MESSPPGISFSNTSGIGGRSDPLAIRSQSSLQSPIAYLAVFMAHRCINQLVDGEALEEVFLLGDKQLRANRNAALYLMAELRDKTGSITARMWNVTEESTAQIKPGDYVRVRGKVQLYLGTLQMIIRPAMICKTRFMDVPPCGESSEVRRRGRSRIDAGGNVWIGGWRWP